MPYAFAFLTAVAASSAPCARAIYDYRRKAFDRACIFSSIAGGAFVGTLMLGMTWIHFLG